MPEPPDHLRRRLADLLAGRGAHVDFATAVRGLAAETAGRRAPGLPHTAWQLVEHLRIALRDLVEYSRSPEHRSPPWPEGYWPQGEAPPSAAAWEESLAAYRLHLAEMIDLVSDADLDLLTPLPWSEDGADLVREALLAAAHASYHVGQLVDLRRALGDWPPPERS
ncbi:MAG TPA: DinB family protein [Thermoanaerobaculia bacterium]|nr:DinB family protein [Thermoanaerobaculia bacterium]